VPVRRIGVVSTRAATEVIVARATTEITAKIQAYTAGEMSRAELVQYLAHEQVPERLDRGHVGGTVQSVGLTRTAIWPR
jgi:hypothetical protein